MTICGIQYEGNMKFTGCEGTAFFWSNMEVFAPETEALFNWAVGIGVLDEEKIPLDPGSLATDGNAQAQELGGAAEEATGKKGKKRGQQAMAAEPKAEPKSKRHTRNSSK